MLYMNPRRWTITDTMAKLIQFIFVVIFKMPKGVRKLYINRTTTLLNQNLTYLCVGQINRPTCIAAQR
jgi:hypothetical protein